jgi:hypothetical protein
MSSGAIIGQVLLWAGFLSGSLATVLNLENKADPWSTIDWVWYAVSAFVCILGIVAIRIGKRAKHTASERTLADYSVLPAAMDHLIANVVELRKSQDELKPSEIVHYIDDRLMDDLRDFADSRESIIPKEGLQDYADIMTQFAAGERAVNRAWSAAADGYVDEVALCLERAESFFRGTREMLK